MRCGNSSGADEGGGPCAAGRAERHKLQPRAVKPCPRGKQRGGRCVVLTRRARQGTGVNPGPAAAPGAASQRRRQLAGCGAAPSRPAPQHPAHPRPTPPSLPPGLWNRRAYSERAAVMLVEAVLGRGGSRRVAAGTGPGYRGGRAPLPGSNWVGERTREAEGKSFQQGRSNFGVALASAAPGPCAPCANERAPCSTERAAPGARARGLCARSGGLQFSK